MAKTNRNYLLAILPAVVFYLVACHDGNLYSPDTEYYLFYAKSLHTTGKLVGPGGNPLVYWPPGYVLLLIPFFLMSNYTFLLNLFLLVVHQVLWVQIIQKLISSKSWQGHTATLLGLNTLVLMVSVYVWSELPFMVLLVFAICQLMVFLDQGYGRGLVLFGMGLFLVLLVRNAGVFLLPGFALFGLFKLSGKSRIFYFLTLGLASCGNAIWNIHRLFVLENQDALGTLVPEFLPFRNIILIFSEIGFNFIPRPMPEVVVASIMILAFGVLMYSIRAWQKPVVLMQMLVMSYLGFWVVIPADPDNMGRFLAPIMPVLLIFLYLAFERLQNFRRWKPILFGISYYLIVISLARVIRNVIIWSNII